jgi:hypothetical protein
MMVESVNPPSSPTPEAVGPDAAEVRQWIGSRLDDIGGSNVAKIETFYVDSETERPEWLVVRPGRFGHHVLVPAREAVGAVGRVWAPYSRETIKQAPKVNTKAPLTRETELELLKHFGIPEGVGRAAELAARGGFEAITASPATQTRS